jgi:sulfate permease, SulP family
MGGFSTLLKSAYTKMFPDMQGYSKKVFASDLAAGITVGIVALPLSLALAIATGVPPILGLYTAAVAGFLAAAFAGSPYSVSGPAAAMVPILSAIIKEHGLTALPYITILAGLLLIFFAVIGIGKFIHKVPESVVLGFTAGVAIVLFFGQLNAFLGLQGLTPHEHFASKALETIKHLGAIAWPALMVGLLTLGIIIGLPKLAQKFRFLSGLAKIPPTLIAVTLATLLVTGVSVFAHVSTLGSAYGALPLGFPDFNAFGFEAKLLFDGSLLKSAAEIAGLIAVESLLCAVVADKLTKTRHQSSKELAAQGIANLGSAMFGGIPATGVIARTGTIIKSGARTRIASLIHALVVISFIVVLAPLASKIPLPALSAVLFFTAYKIAEVKEIKQFIREKSWKLSLVLATTMLLTIFTDLIIGVASGLVLHLAFATHGKLVTCREQDGPVKLDEQEM